MSQLSEGKRRKVEEEILSILYSSGLKPMSTSMIAEEAARDDEFILKLLLGLEEKSLVKRPKQCSEYKRRKLWVMSEKAYSAYRGLIS